MHKPTGPPGPSDANPAYGKVHAGRPQQDPQHDAQPVSPFQELQHTASSSLQDQHSGSAGATPSAAPAANAEQDATSGAGTAGVDTRNPGQAPGGCPGQQPDASGAKHQQQADAQTILPSQQAASFSNQDKDPSSPMSVRQGPVRSKRPSHAGSEPLASFSRVDTAE